MFDSVAAEIAEPDWFDDPVYSSSMSDSERVSVLKAMPPAARPAQELARINPRLLTSGARIDLLTMLDEQSNWLESLKIRSLAEIENADSTELRLSQEVVSLALNVPTRTAQNKLAAARTMTRELPNTLQLLGNGKISARHAQVITEASWKLDPELIGEFEASVTEHADELTVAQLQREVRRKIGELDPATAEERQQRASADRKVGFVPCDDGMALLPVLLPAAEGQLIFTRLTAAAKLLPSHDHRNLDQQRADLLVDAVLVGLPHDALPELQGRRPSIQVVVGADTLLGLDDQPADLAGYGPITAETARRLAADESGTWRRLLTDPDTGQLLDISEQQYRPSQRLRDFVAVRDGVCCFPTCSQPGYRCEYEHIVPYLSGGQTCRCNAALACKRHNRCKIDTGWEYRLDADGGFSWTSDTGHRYRGRPPQRWTQPRPPSQTLPARNRPTPFTLENWYALEDAAYERLAARQQRELEQARSSADQKRTARAQKAIAAAKDQQDQVLARRKTHPDQPF